MTNSEYWARRMRILQDVLLCKNYEYVENLEKQYSLAISSIEKDISVWYQRLADNNEITLAEARKLLRADELKEFRWTVEEYIAKGEANALTGEWVKQLENASARVHISRLDALKLQLRQQAEELYGRQRKELEIALGDIYSRGYFHTAFEVQKGVGVGWTLMGTASREIESVLSRPWTADGQTFSDRCWTNRRALVNSLNTKITQMVMRGEAPRKTIDAIAKEFNVSKSKAGRLVMTESAAFANRAQEDCFKDLGVERYVIVGTLDGTTCELCGALDGKVYPMSERETGVTAPPFHPWCRCVTAPYYEDLEGIGDRFARDENGEVYSVPKDMSYGEWKTQQDARYEHENVDRVQEKSYNNKIDNEQYNRYRRLLADKAPRTFAEFQNIKYNKYSDEYSALKLQYADAKIQARIHNGEIATRVLDGKQGKHILGHNNYVKGKSYLYDGVDPQALVDRYAGTGIIKRDAAGNWSHKEIVVADKYIGCAVSLDGAETPTKTFVIHYSKKGTHIVPRKGVV